MIANSHFKKLSEYEQRKPKFRKPLLTESQMEHLQDEVSVEPTGLQNFNAIPVKKETPTTIYAISDIALELQLNLFILLRSKYIQDLFQEDPFKDLLEITSDFFEADHSKDSPLPDSVIIGHLLHFYSSSNTLEPVPLLFNHEIQQHYLAKKKETTDAITAQDNLFAGCGLFTSGLNKLLMVLNNQEVLDKYSSKGLNNYGLFSIWATEISLHKSTVFKVRVAIGNTKQLVIEFPVEDFFKNKTTIKDVIGKVKICCPYLNILLVTVKQLFTQKFFQIPWSATLHEAKSLIDQSPGLRISINIVPNLKGMSKKDRNKLKIRENFWVAVNGSISISRCFHQEKFSDESSLLGTISAAIPDHLPRFVVMVIRGFQAKAENILLRKFSLRDLGKQIPKGMSNFSAYSWIGAITSDNHFIEAPVSGKRLTSNSDTSLLLWKSVGSFLKPRTITKDGGESLGSLNKVIYELE